MSDDFLKQFTEKIHFLFHRCWKISNQKEVKTWIVNSLKYVKENVFQTMSIPRAAPKKINKDIDNATHQYYKFGCRSENPDAKEFGYNDNLIRIQRNVSHTLGNTRGWFDRKRSWDNVTNDKVSKKHMLVWGLYWRYLGVYLQGNGIYVDKLTWFYSV